MPLAPAQLQQVALSHLRFEVNVDYDPARHSAGMTYEVQPEVTITELTRDEGGLRGGVLLAAQVAFSRTATVEEGEEALPLPFELELQLWGIFAWSADEMPDDDLGRAWLEYNGMYLMWPYLRSYVATITGMSHLPQLTIYTMNVPNPPVLEGDESVELGDDAVDTVAAEE